MFRSDSLTSKPFLIVYLTVPQNVFNHYLVYDFLTQEFLNKKQLGISLQNHKKMKDNSITVNFHVFTKACFCSFRIFTSSLPRDVVIFALQKLIQTHTKHFLGRKKATSICHKQWKDLTWLNPKCWPNYLWALEKTCKKLVKITFPTLCYSRTPYKISKNVHGVSDYKIWKHPN